MTIRLSAVPAALALACVSFVAPTAAVDARPQPKKAAPAKAAPVSATAIGSVVEGNPNAKHKLVEYVSYTCSHCADFSKESTLPLKSYIKAGTTSVEYRSIVRDPFDFAAALLAHCGGTARFPGNHAYLMANQSVWIDNARRATDAQQNAWNLGDYTTRMTAIAKDIGLIRMMQTRGVTAAQSKACLANVTKQDQLLTMTDAAGKLGIEGTPSFLLNGVLLRDVHDWAGVKAVLDKKP